MRNCIYSVKYGPTHWCDIDRNALVVCVLESEAFCKNKVNIEDKATNNKEQQCH
jgi:hypothetical protein